MSRIYRKKECAVRFLPPVLCVIVLLWMTAAAVFAAAPAGGAESSPLMSGRSLQDPEALPLLSAEDASEDPALWSEDYYRAVDATGRLSDAERQRLDAMCIEFMQDYHADLSLLAVTRDVLGDYTMEEYAAGYYDSCGFGYGENRDGFQMIWDTDSGRMAIFAYGSASSLIPQSYLDFAAKSSPEYEKEYGAYGPFYASARFLSNYLRGSGEETAQAVSGSGVQDAEIPDPGSQDAETREGEAQDTEIRETQAQDAEARETQTQDAEAREAAENVTSSDALSVESTQESKGADASESIDAEAARGPVTGEIPDSSLRVGEGSSMPAWYPADPATFPYYHDENAPRVVDTADIFTEEEEASMEARLAEIRRELSRDIVVFTDVSTYGLSRSVYAADFYDFNGYGFGEDREGVCLMICMEPGNRGGWTCCTGPETRGLYTETIANQIDDMLYDFLGAGSYYEGVADWIENFRRLYVTGSPYSEEWQLLSEDDFVRFHDPDAPRVVDDALILTGDEIARLTQEAGDLSDQYGLDVVIHTARSSGITDSDEYGDKYFYFKGYGFGDDYDGICLTIFKRPGYTGEAYVSASGKGLEKLSGVNKSRLESRCSSLVSAQEFCEAASQWISQTGHMLRTGRAPRSSASWKFTVILSMLAGLLFGITSLGRAKRSMATPKLRENANHYLKKDSVQVRSVENRFLHSTTHRRYSPVKEEKSGGSGHSGGSSYSGSYHGSSGSSHSGSGRSF